MFLPQDVRSQEREKQMSKVLRFLKIVQSILSAGIFGIFLSIPFQYSDSKASDLEIDEISPYNGRSKQKLKLNNFDFGSDVKHGNEHKESVYPEFRLASDDGYNLYHVFHPFSLIKTARKVDLNLAKLVISLGGKVAILQQEGLMDQVMQDFTEEESKKIKFIAGLPIVTRWVQNYLGLSGLFAYGPKVGSIFGFNLNQDDRAGDEIISQIVSNRLSIDFQHVLLKMQGGSILPVGHNTALVSRRIIHDNLHLSRQGVETELRRMGIEKIIWLPWLTGEGAGHIDLCVAYLNGQMVVPKIDDQAIQLSPEPEIASLARDSLDKIATLLSAHGFNVNRLMMPVTSGLSDRGILAYYTPVNWLVVRGESGPNLGRTHVIVPVPDTLRSDSGLIPQYQEINRQVFKKLGVIPIFVGTSLPEWGGGFRCISSCMPDKFFTI